MRRSSGAGVTGEKSLYEALELPRNATDADVKRAYKRLALIHHPDKPSGNTEKFNLISKAYEVCGL